MRLVVPLTLVALFALAATGGCQKKEPPAPPADKASEGIASEEDFEDEAEREITDQTFDAELAKMEKEIP